MDYRNRPHPDAPRVIDLSARATALPLAVALSIVLWALILACVFLPA